jgi:Fungal Zn(2)-Cys(6) binuclear cluster domain
MIDRTRHTKCDEEKPACKKCRILEKECSYNYQPPKTNLPPKELLPWPLIPSQYSTVETPGPIENNTTMATKPNNYQTACLIHGMFSLLRTKERLVLGVQGHVTVESEQSLDIKQ